MYNRHSKRKRLWKTQQGRCFYCGCAMTDCEDTNRTKRDPLPTATTIDHAIPKAMGGTHSFSNLRLACYACNGAKADKLNWVPGW